MPLLACFRMSRTGAQALSARAKKDDGLMFYCRTCVAPITSNRLRRFLSLPSSDWYEVAESWFCGACCGGGDKAMTMAMQLRSRLAPTPGICLVGRRACVLHMDDVVEQLADNAMDGLMENQEQEGHATHEHHCKIENRAAYSKFACQGAVGERGLLVVPSLSASKSRGAPTEAGEEQEAGLVVLRGQALCSEGSRTDPYSCNEIETGCMDGKNASQVDVQKEELSHVCGGRLLGDEGAGECTRLDGFALTCEGVDKTNDSTSTRPRVDNASTTLNGSEFSRDGVDEIRKWGCHGECCVAEEVENVSPIHVESQAVDDTGSVEALHDDGADDGCASCTEKHKAGSCRLRSDIEGGTECEEGGSPLSDDLGNWWRESGHVCRVVRCWGCHKVIGTYSHKKGPKGLEVLKHRVTTEVESRGDRCVFRWHTLESIFAAEAAAMSAEHGCYRFAVWAFPENGKKQFVILQIVVLNAEAWISTGKSAEPETTKELSLCTEDNKEACELVPVMKLMYRDCLNLADDERSWSGRRSPELGEVAELWE
ncbi:hypothetical protein CBR_g8866 [Chara braunii]|uniref:Uncharacterized protein n=1 Tax=Chara braunii TaxID=69332 RepID=A0A388KN66_CHABU|nr:hypothetical protein CBR_g8866 [Chara braunii]|eukprot:GBG71448.1 hypothetical protein CBR_g8866 [Chara braunii]